ncbi:hypothetical protein SCLCIDRAFT_1118501 [Scleroderma citrinum Foug A]|uniref:Uncharacterized protein n=1 Tax=Scleroderma citrinum Foug A TaxID=1036808 RepID=A0A0C3DAR7_9AGAM|nr:hypothetical protein SCLCIDRAFT_1118501 [Scleroderma citrinum Foug A]
MCRKREALRWSTGSMIRASSRLPRQSASAHLPNTRSILDGFHVSSLCRFSAALENSTCGMWKKERYTFKPGTMPKVQRRDHNG